MHDGAAFSRLRRRKVRFAPTSLFHKKVIRPLPCSSFPQKGTAYAPKPL
jgi:hypothetical protein